MSHDTTKCYECGRGLETEEEFETGVCFGCGLLIDAPPTLAPVDSYLDTNGERLPEADYNLAEAEED